MIELTNVRYAYAGRRVLENMSLRLPDGCVTAVIGPNGAGKSTALRLMAGLFRPEFGSVRVDGIDPSASPRWETARRIAFLPQERPVPALTVEELAAHGRYAYHPGSGRLTPADRDAVCRALALTGMEHLRTRDLRSLSGGQRQKAYLAMAVAQDTCNLVLDEPFVHLDIGFQLELCRLLDRLAWEGCCVCVVMHDLPLVPRLCGRVALIDRGCARFVGTPQGCFQSAAFERAFGVRLAQTPGYTFE